LVRVYTCNLTRVVVEFTADGGVLPEVYVQIVQAFRFWPTAGSIILAILESLVAAFVIYEYIFTEIKEVLYLINTATEKLKQIRALEEDGLAKKRLSTAWQGRLNGVGLCIFYIYSKLLTDEDLSSAWNYYEIFTATVFFVLVGLTIYSWILVGRLQFYPQYTTYVDFLSLASNNALLRDVYGAYLMLCWLRLLKFFRIPPWSGPLVQSVLDTLMNKNVYVFFLIIIYVIFSFSVAFHVAFGADVVEFNYFPTSLYGYTILYD
jgi:hypothetical protein